MASQWNRREIARLAAAGAAFAPGGARGQAAADPIESAYSPGEARWQVGWPGRLSQHDVVYLSPPEDPMLGLPIGNGDLGALLWTNDSQLILAINKCDTWDDNEPRPFKGWGANEEERHTALRHCGRLVIDFGCPVFDLLYQQNFEARLELATAQASLRASTPFAKVAARSYISAPHRVLVMRCEADGSEPVAPSVRLERWGSRTFAHWYSQVNRDPSNGLDGTQTRIERGRIVIHQKLRTLSFALAALVVPDSGPVEPRQQHSRAATTELPRAAKNGFTVYVTAVTSENAADPVAAAHLILDQAAAAGEAAIAAKHQEEWRAFWSASMVDLPEKYLENIWHTNLYLANSSSRGAYPPHFCNGLWGWNRDFLPWNYYFHWNMQWYVWPLAAANHAELAAPYYRLRSTQLPMAMEYASQRLKRPGAFYADVSDRRGYNDAGLNHNQTPGAQVALDFWRHYAYTGDEQFLRNSAWPILREVARYNAATLQEGADGLLHVSKTSAYEGSPLFEDTITDLAMMRGLFPAAIRAGKLVGHDPAELERWEKQLARLAPFRLADLEPFESENKGGTEVHRSGLAPGQPLASRKVFAVGRNDKGSWVRNRHAGRPDLSYYGIPDPELAPVFPAGVIGLGQRGTELFRAAVTQVRLHPPTVPAKDGSVVGTMSGSGELCMGWCPYPIALARLGLADELAAELVNSVSTWQYYPQGFGHYGPYHVFTPDAEQRWRLNEVRDAATVAPGSQASKFPFPAWPFRHFDNEAMPIVATAINEMLLQSHDGVIRICPAVPQQWEVRFDLSAQGGFRVSAERKGGRTSWVAVESRRGGTCCLAHPWPNDEQLVCLDLSARNRTVGLSEERTAAERVLRWVTVAGHRYLLVRQESALAQWRVSGIAPAPRSTPRTLKKAKLGRERLY